MSKTNNTLSNENSTIINSLNETFVTSNLSNEQIETLIVNRSDEGSVVVKTDLSQVENAESLTFSLSGFVLSDAKKLVLPISHPSEHLSALMVEKKPDGKIEVVYFDPIGFVNDSQTIVSDNSQIYQNSSIPAHIVKAIKEGLKVDQSEVKFSEDNIQSSFYNIEDNNQIYSSVADSKIITCEILTSFAAGNLAFKNTPHFKLNDKNDIDNVADSDCSNLVRIAVSKNDNSDSKDDNELFFFPELDNQNKDIFAKDLLSSQLKDLVKIYEIQYPQLVHDLKNFRHEENIDSKNNAKKSSGKTSQNSASNNFNVSSILKSLLPLSVFSALVSGVSANSNSDSLAKIEMKENPINNDKFSSSSIVPPALPRPTANPTFAPPTLRPSLRPSLSPSIIPSILPSAEPSLIPTAAPSAKPSLTPSIHPSMIPSQSPNKAPTISQSPSKNPTHQPSDSSQILSSKLAEPNPDYRSIIYSTIIGGGAGALSELTWQCASSGGSLGSTLLQLYQENPIPSTAASIAFGGFSSLVGYLASFQQEKYNQNSADSENDLTANPPSSQPSAQMNISSNPQPKNESSNSTILNPSALPTLAPSEQKKLAEINNFFDNQYFGRGYFFEGDDKNNFGPEGAVAGAVAASAFLISMIAFSCCCKGCKNIVPSRGVEPNYSNSLQLPPAYNPNRRI